MKLESLNSEKFKSFSPNQLKNILGGEINNTGAGTFIYQNDWRDVEVNGQIIRQYKKRSYSFDTFQTVQTPEGPVVYENYGWSGDYYWS